jgi:hypothetical protein
MGTTVSQAKGGEAACVVAAVCPATLNVPTATQLPPTSQARIPQHGVLRGITCV